MMIIGERSWSNMWIIKGIMRGFELMSGLYVNFHKSKSYGINLKEPCLKTTYSFLTCCIGKIPLLLLEIPIGASSRRN